MRAYHETVVYPLTLSHPNLLSQKEPFLIISVSRLSSGYFPNSEQCYFLI